MRNIFGLLALICCLTSISTASAEEFENTDIFAPWNDPLMQDDMFAPWNDPLLEDDIAAPWNDPFAGPDETNEYLRDQGVRDSEYYWQ